MDVPVAVPLRVPSPETTRRRQSNIQNQDLFDSFPQHEEEVDIGILPSSAPILHHADLLDLGTPTSELPRTSLGAKTPEDSTAPRPAEYAAADPFNDNHGEDFHDLEEHDLLKPPHMNGRIKLQRHFSTQSVPGHSSHMPKKVGGRRGSRRYSIGPRLGYVDGDDEFEEGDLGFSAAEDQEGRTRRVIVERLETVKTRNPVFSWC
jgi:phosphatidylinositol 4-kinase type 2